PAGQYSITWWNPVPAGVPAQLQFDHYPHAGGDLWTPPAPSAGDWVLLVRNEVLPKAVDMAIKVDDGKAFVRPGDSVTYTIEASTLGYDTSATGGVVTDSFPPDLTGVNWTCTASPGATCPPSGAGDIAAVVTLPVGSKVVFSATGTLTGSPPMLIN